MNQFLTEDTTDDATIKAIIRLAKRKKQRPKLPRYEIISEARALNKN